MKIDVSFALRTLEEAPLRESEGGPEMTVGSVLTQAALSAPEPGKSRSAEEQIERYAVALAIRAAKKKAESEIEISAEFAAKLKGDITRMWGPIVGGQVLPLLDGK